MLQIVIAVLDGALQDMIATGVHGHVVDVPRHLQLPESAEFRHPMVCCGASHQGPCSSTSTSRMGSIIEALKGCMRSIVK